MKKYRIKGASAAQMREFYQKLERLETDSEGEITVDQVIAVADRVSSSSRKDFIHEQVSQQSYRAASSR
jgi:hypothetical protein